MSRSAGLHLTRLQMDRMPGLQPPFAIDAQPGVNLIIGPNESGKSSIVRAVRLLLWPDERAPVPFQVGAVFADAEGPLRANRAADVSEPWQRDGQDTGGPALPAAHLAACYRLGLLDLHREKSGADEHLLATELRRQMAGGFALEPVRASFADESQRLKLAQTPLREKTKTLGLCEKNQEILAGQERGLASLRAELRSAEQARLKLTQLQAALACHQWDRKQEELTAQLVELPSGTNQTRDDDDDQLAGLDQRLGALVRSVADLTEQIDQRRAKISAAEIKGDTTSLELLITAAEETDKAAQSSARLFDTATAAVEAARRDLAPELVEAAMDPGSVDAVRQLIAQNGKQVQLEARLEAQDVALAALEDPPESPDSSSETALPFLALVSPGPTGLILGLLGLGAGTLLFVMNQTAAAVGCASAGVVFMAQYLWARRQYAAARRQYEQYSQAVGTPLPSGWSTAEGHNLVGDTLQSAGFATGARQTRAEARDVLHQRRQEAERQRRQADEQRRLLLAKYEQDPARDSSDVAHEWDRLRRWRDSADLHAQAQGTRDHDTQAAAAACRAAGACLNTLGEKAGDTLTNVQAAQKRIQARQIETARWQDALAIDEKALRLEQSHLVGVQDERHRLLLCLGLAGGEASAEEVAVLVAHLVSALPDWERLSDEQRLATEARAREAAILEDETAQALLALTDEELLSFAAEEEVKAASPDGLMQEIGALEQRIKSARAGRELELASAAVEKENDRISDLLDSQRLGLAARLLLADVAGEHERDTMPPVLQEMNRLVGDFTGGRYALRIIGEEKTPNFVALGENDQRLGLEQLSDGTRAQLLLAARLAFLNRSEGDVRLPLFLDEALTASDPVRFAAIATALGNLAADSGRQIFYLTSNPSDVGAWTLALAEAGLATPHLIDLGAIRQVSAAATPAQLASRPPPAIPAWNGQDAAAYGRQLAVPTLDPRRDPSEAHVFYLCPGDLALVRRLMVAGIETLGRWHRLGPDLVKAGRFTKTEGDGVSARGEMYRHFVDLWRTGRNRPLSREVLQDSRAFTDKFMAPAIRLMESLHADAAKFLAAVIEGEIPRFRAENKETLREFLTSHKFIDERGSLTPDDLVAQVLSASSADFEDDEVRRLVLGFLDSAATKNQNS
ncbi:MAG: AAA family ATPase [Candidatus Krumholzibacteria bacterium]|nr:AAA family ATPase [Candidatus Krumholzibacteria bacterium]